MSEKNDLNKYLDQKIEVSIFEAIMAAGMIFLIGAVGILFIQEFVKLLTLLF